MTSHRSPLLLYYSIESEVSYQIFHSKLSFCSMLVLFWILNQRKMMIVVKFLFSVIHHFRLNNFIHVITSNYTLIVRPVMCEGWNCIHVESTCITPPLLIKVSVQSHESERSCMR